MTGTRASRPLAAHAGRKRWANTQGSAHFSATSSRGEQRATALSEKAPSGREARASGAWLRLRVGIGVLRSTPVGGRRTGIAERRDHDWHAGSTATAGMAGAVIFDNAKFADERGELAGEFAGIAAGPGIVSAEDEMGAAGVFPFAETEAVEAVFDEEAVVLEGAGEGVRGGAGRRVLVDVNGRRDGQEGAEMEVAGGIKAGGEVGVFRDGPEGGPDVGGAVGFAAENFPGNDGADDVGNAGGEFLVAEAAGKLGQPRGGGGGKLRGDARAAEVGPMDDFGLEIGAGGAEAIEFEQRDAVGEDEKGGSRGGGSGENGFGEVGGDERGGLAGGEEVGERIVGGGEHDRVRDLGAHDEDAGAQVGSTENGNEAGGGADGRVPETVGGERPLGGEPGLWKRDGGDGGRRMGWWRGRGWLVGEVGVRRFPWPEKQEQGNHGGEGEGNRDGLRPKACEPGEGRWSRRGSGGRSQGGHHVAHGGLVGLAAHDGEDGVFDGEAFSGGGVEEAQDGVEAFLFEQTAEGGGIGGERGLEARLFVGG